MIISDIRTHLLSVPFTVPPKTGFLDLKNIELLKKVHYLLKEQGMTINGVKKILNNKEPLNLDEISNHSIKAINLKIKLEKISNIIKDLKKLK